jgi:hypothetical protein
MSMNVRGAVGATEKDASRIRHFNKTKMCKFNMVGACSKGPACPYAHSTAEMRALPDLTRTKLCKALIDTGVCNDAACAYAHNKVELRTTSMYHKTKLCRYSLMGHCSLGSKCNFAHAADELRPTDAATSDGEDQSMQVNFGVGQMTCPPGLELYNASNPLCSMSPVRILLNSNDTDAPCLSQTRFIPKIGEGLLRSVRSVGDRFSDLGRDEPAFVKPSWTIQSAGSRFADLGDPRCDQKDLSAGLDHYFEGDNSSTPSCLSPRSVYSTDHGDDHCQVASLSAWDMQKKTADKLLDALRVPAA